MFGLLTNSEQGFGLSKQRDIIPDNGWRHPYLWLIKGGGQYIDLYFLYKYDLLPKIKRDYYKLHYLVNIVEKIKQIEIA